jgi:hypothetical protein
MDTLLVGKYRFSSNFQKPAILPPYKGSTFRGVFGHALKNIVCTFTSHTCDQCLLVRQCVYVKIFEPHRLKIQPMANMKQMTSMPSPFVIEPPLTQKTHYDTNDFFDFDLLLFGATNELLPYYIYAFDKIGYIGVGKSIDGQRGQFTLKTVVTSGEKVYQNHRNKVYHYLKTTHLSNLAILLSHKSPIFI